MRLMIVSKSQLQATLPNERCTASPRTRLADSVLFTTYPRSGIVSLRFHALHWRVVSGVKGAEGELP